MKSLRTSSAGTERKNARLFLTSILALGLLIAAAACVGAAKIQAADISGLFTGDYTRSGTRILRYVRLPRIVAALFAGAGLAASGAIIQTLLGNPIAGPNIIGVNAGAGLGAALCCVIAPAAVGVVPVAAFAGALAAMLLVYGIAKKTGASRLTLVLAGVAISSLLNALTDTVQTLVPDALVSTTEFRIGGLSAVSEQVLLPACALILLALAVACLMHRELDLLALGDETAASLGLRVKGCRFVLLLCAAACAGAAVSFAGLVGFLGLIVPHAARFFVGSEARRLLPLSALWGAGLMLACDTLARTLFAPYELPVGILLAVLGAPFFLWLLVRRKGVHAGA